MYFLYVVIKLVLKRALPFICTNLNPLYWRMFCVKFDWYLSSGSVEKDFEILSKHVRFFCYFSPWKRAWLHLSKLESPSFKDALFKDWLKLAQWFCKRSRKWGKFTDRHTMDDIRSLKLSAHVAKKEDWQLAFHLPKSSWKYLLYSVYWPWCVRK